MKKGIFEVFGGNQLGLKADDLNENHQVLSDIGFIVPESMVIAVEVFYGLPKVKDKVDCPDFLLSINNEILDKMKIGIPYAIRSTALSERGGTGIYKSTFFVSTGNRDNDLHCLWLCEISVYDSEFTLDAVRWREKNNHAPIGMAILIQPVIGFKLGDDFLPTLSGTAYTSLNGMPTVRTVIGLGTLAVNGQGIIDHQPYDDSLRLQRSLWDQEFADAITTSGDLIKINSHNPEIHNEIVSEFGTFNQLFDFLTELQKHGNFYLEWVIFKGKIFVVQCAVYEDRAPGNMDIDTTDYFLLLESEDVVHSGRSSCKSIIFVDNWSAEISSILEHLNQTYNDFLLIIPQDALSELADIIYGNSLSFRHFSNAKAVIEMQRTYTMNQRFQLLQAGIHLADHTSGRGATHFSQVCQRSDILFVGGEFDQTLLSSLPGGMKFHQNPNIIIWNNQAEILVDAVKKEGFVYIYKHPKINQYTFYQIQSWADNLYDTAGIYASKNHDLSDHIYNVCYAIIPNRNPLEFDPFTLNQSEIERLGGTDKIIESLKIVIENSKLFADSKLKNYLQELLSHLVNA